MSTYLVSESILMMSMRSERAFSTSTSSRRGVLFEKCFSNTCSVSSFRDPFDVA